MFLCLQESFEELEKMKLRSWVYSQRYKHFDNHIHTTGIYSSSAGLPWHVFKYRQPHIETWLWFSNSTANESTLRSVKLYSLRQGCNHASKLGVRIGRSSNRGREAPEFWGRCPNRRRSQRNSWERVWGGGSFLTSEYNRPLLKALLKIVGQ